MTPKNLFTACVVLFLLQLTSIAVLWSAWGLARLAELGFDSNTSPLLLACLGLLTLLTGAHAVSNYILMVQAKKTA